MTAREDRRGDAAREMPRPRDMPPPREADGAAAPAMRRIFDWPFRAILAAVVALRLSPMQLTFLGLATNVVIGWLLIEGQALLAGLLLIPAGLFDLLDGAVARLRGTASRFGAFTDAVLDRVSDMILFGCLYWMLSGQGKELEAALALATLVISLTVSHIRAEAEAVGVSLSEGLFQRLERYLAMMIGLMFPGMLLPMLVLLTALGGFTVIQRGWNALTRAPTAT
ncbi:MAG TPA: CDP-alcohol phosphatidyltransferase family protein [Actinomycetota bacterium]|nr:CDP-alcohol phosphatidyltransferase family protein [Actinomycetota bacterium]